MVLAFKLKRFLVLLEMTHFKNYCEIIINNCSFKIYKHSHSGLQKMEPE
ncbi:uncharacterized protein METZ01_LOCUS3112 [marine metagenome]|uniref:Uncharacterized protein n=1 Tax=marine metagenome TaxID=408172 RepID=A0A381N965_9ZZZZ